MYDLIGDVHGHADELSALLARLGYREDGGVHRRPGRKALFLGDLIDRGPKIRETLGIVRAMADAGEALVVTGNHEFNALAYHTPDPASPGEFLRPHRPQNVLQHHQTVSQLSPEELNDALDWFRTLPLFLRLDGLRAVHACWDERAFAVIAEELERHGGVSTPFLSAACTPDSALFAAVEVVLKGREASLPAGLFFLDKDGHRRMRIRTRWYLDPAGHSYGSYALHADAVASDAALAEEVGLHAVPYPADADPVFVGHYWLSADRPGLLAPNVACLDYSVAKQGFLCAYRWDGERTLDPEKFAWVRTDRP